MTDVIVTCGCGPEDRCPQDNTNKPCAMRIPELDLIRITNDVVVARFRATQYEENKKMDGKILRDHDDRDEEFRRQLTEDIEKLKEEHPAASRFVRAESDERTVNNVMRHEYRVLSEFEKEMMRQIKDLGVRFVNTLHNVGGTGGSDRQASRELSIAQTKIEEAVMWAVKHVTR